MATGSVKGGSATYTTTFSGTTDVTGNVLLLSSHVDIIILVPNSTSDYLFVPFNSPNGRTYAHVTTFSGDVKQFTAVGGTITYRTVN